MSSLLTNNSAMVALQTLKTINKNMAEVQNEVSTGKRIANARDNAALWGISTTMSSDVSGFKAISESLSLGAATLTVGREGAEMVASLLDQLKGKVVAAQEENVDRSKIQADVKELINQIGVVVDGAQFNGLNLLKGRDEVNILASLNRNELGEVSASRITFTQRDLSQTEGVYGGGAAVTGATFAVPDGTLVAAPAGTSVVAIAGAATANGTTSFVVAGETISYAVTAFATDGTVAAIGNAFATAINQNNTLKEKGITASFAGSNVTITSTNSFEAFTVGTFTSLAGAGLSAADTALEMQAQRITLTGHNVQEGDSYRITLGSTNYDYVARDGDTINTVLTNIQAKMKANSQTVGWKFKLDTAANPVSGANVATLFVDSTITGAFSGASSTGGTVGGGMEMLSYFDVTLDNGPEAALDAMEGLIQNAISAAAHFGSAQGRIQTQTEFVSKIMDGLTSGIGALVDADMEAASARLQALQVQQQLGIQALSIANQQPQNILALFRQ